MRYPTDNDNANQGTECNQTSVNICVEVRTVERIHRSGYIYVFPKLLIAREPTTNDCKYQGTQMTLDS